MPGTLARVQTLAMEGGLLLGAREGPGRLAPALLPEDEAQLARRAQSVGMIRTEGGARLVELEGAEAVAGEEALLARDLVRPLGAARRCDDCRQLQEPPGSRLRHTTRGDGSEARAHVQAPPARRIRKT